MTAGYTAGSLAAFHGEHECQVIERAFPSFRRLGPKGKGKLWGGGKGKIGFIGKKQVAKMKKREQELDEKQQKQE